jgi:tetratricopeptide (TPR) repeat protein
MRPLALVFTLFFLLLPTSLSAQLTQEILDARIMAAKEDGHAEALIAAANAARFMRDFDQAEELLQLASEAMADAQFDALWGRISLELASGGGVNGAQRAMREERARRDVPPLEIAYWVNNFPILLVGGEFDEMIQRFSADAEDPNYQCACYDRKAWMMRVAGDWDGAQVYWDSLVVAQEASPTYPDDPDQFAEFQGQLARNYARAGREADARRTLEGAMALPVSDEAMATVRRRWAQAYAELGDVEKAVEHLEILLSTPSLVTVHTLQTRLAWERIRNDPAFRQLIERHR